MLGGRIAFREFFEIFPLCLAQFIHQPGNFFWRGPVFNRFGQFILRALELLCRLLQIAVLDLKRQYPKQLGCGLKIRTRLKIADYIGQDFGILRVAEQSFRGL